MAAALLSEAAEAGINGGRLAAAGRAGQQQQAGGLTQEPFQFRPGFGSETQLIEGLDAGVVEKAEDDLLARHGRIGGNADVGAGVEGGLVDAAILWEGFLIGLEPGKELDAAKDAFGDCGRQVSRWRHHAVEPEGNRGCARAHVEMNITGPSALRLLHETLQDLRRGLFRARSVPTGYGAMFSHNVSGRDHGIINGVEQPEYFWCDILPARRTDVPWSRGGGRVQGSSSATRGFPPSLLAPVRPPRPTTSTGL